MEQLVIPRCSEHCESLLMEQRFELLNCFKVEGTLFFLVFDKISTANGIA